MTRKCPQCDGLFQWQIVGYYNNKAGKKTAIWVEWCEECGYAELHRRTE